jgi:predicted membrane channel-forming protein YqfA (hemolysin III family)
MNTIDRFKIASGYIVGTATFIGCLAIAVQLEHWWFNVLLCLFGGILGWTIGMFTSPLNPDERREFSEYGKAIYAFIGGFAIAKLEALFTAITAKDLLNVTAGARWLLFGTTFFLALQFTFVGRRYFRLDPAPIEPAP